MEKSSGREKIELTPKMKSVFNFGKFTLSLTLVEKENLKVFIIKNTYSTWQVRQEIIDVSHHLRFDFRFGFGFGFGK